jgi:hypothetical protein
MKLSPHEMAWCLKQAGFTGIDQPTQLDNIVLGVAIGLAESLGETDALAITSSGSNVGNRDHGVWQISGKFHGDKIQRTPNWRDPLVNARLTKAIYDEAIRAGRSSGWQPWATYKVDPDTGKAFYMEFLAAARIAATATWAPSYPGWHIAAIQDRVEFTQGRVDTLPSLSAIRSMIMGMRFITTDTMRFVESS